MTEERPQLKPGQSSLTEPTVQVGRFRLFPRGVKTIPANSPTLILGPGSNRVAVFTFPVTTGLQYELYPFGGFTMSAAVSPTTTPEPRQWHMASQPTLTQGEVYVYTQSGIDIMVYELLNG